MIPDTAHRYADPDGDISEMREAKTYLIPRVARITR